MPVDELKVQGDGEDETEVLTKVFGLSFVDALRSDVKILSHSAKKNAHYCDRRCRKS